MMSHDCPQCRDLTFDELPIRGWQVQTSSAAQRSGRVYACTLVLPNQHGGVIHTVTGQSETGRRPGPRPSSSRTGGDGCRQKRGAGRKVRRTNDQRRHAGRNGAAEQLMIVRSAGCYTRPTDSTSWRASLRRGCLRLVLVLRHRHHDVLVGGSSPHDKWPTGVVIARKDGQVDLPRQEDHDVRR